jgi:hypothetical protein
MASLITVGGSASTGAGVTFGDLIEKVYRRLMGGLRERTVQLVSHIDDVTTTVVVTGAQAGSIAPGVIFSCELELMYVTGWSANTNTATVIRGYYNSVPSEHDALMLVYLNPRYSRYDIGVAINDDLRSLSGPTNGLFRVGVAQLTYNPVFQGYDLGDLPSNFIDILEIRYQIAPPYRTFPPIKKWKVIRWESQPGGITAPAFPSGRGLVVYEPGWPGLPIYVTYSAPFIRFIDTADNVYNTPVINDEAPPNNGYSTDTVQNLVPTQVDLPPLGAEIDLTLPREVSRNFMEAQPDPRKAQEVPPGAVAGSVNALINRRMQRISEEADRLQRQYTRIRSW